MYLPAILGWVSVEIVRRRWCDFHKRVTFPPRRRRLSSDDRRASPNQRDANHSVPKKRKNDRIHFANANRADNRLPLNRVPSQYRNLDRHMTLGVKVRYLEALNMQHYSTAWSQMPNWYSRGVEEGGRRANISINIYRHRQKTVVTQKTSFSEKIDFRVRIFLRCKSGYRSKLFYGVSFIKKSFFFC